MFNSQLVSLARPQDQPHNIKMLSWYDPIAHPIYYMSNLNLNVAIDDISLLMSPISAGKYYDLIQQAISISEDYTYYFQLDELIQSINPPFDLSRLYAALSTLFGPSSTLYDPYKCSFSYPFLIQLTKHLHQARYALNFTDMKGGLSFKFSKILTHPDDIKKYPDTIKLYAPLPGEFSRNHMNFFMSWFIAYLIGFINFFEKYYSVEYVRTLEYCKIMYGYQDNQFFQKEFTGI